MGLALLAVGGVDDKDDAFTYLLTRVRIASGIVSGGYSAPRAKAIRTVRGMRQSAQKVLLQGSTNSFACGGACGQEPSAR